jgi:eukaryotic-like serine/threonine-protein kinase
MVDADRGPPCANQGHVLELVAKPIQMPDGLQRELAVLLELLKAEGPVDREKAFQRYCGCDIEMRNRIESQLRAYEAEQEERGNTLPAAAIGDPLASDSHADVGSSNHPPEDVPSTMPLPARKVESSTRFVAGRYRIVQHVSEGGMGSVWKADQLEPIKRRVAVKLIKPGMANKRTVARFEAERQALAMMNHRNIAKVYDGGTDNGQPFLVMEYVAGIPLTEYCDQRHLGIGARLNLLVETCDAVAHAHQKGIIHRDLKPSNILVTEEDGRALAKVIDFGLAKALEGSHLLTDHTLATRFGMVIGTLQYMAPEQLGVNALDVDTRADVYGLGAILYELLTNTTPIEQRLLEHAPQDEIVRLVREEPPERPSSRLSLSKTLSESARSRDTAPERLLREVRGDLDWIALKALEKDRTHRYQSVRELADDLQAYLSGKPIKARPITRLDRTWRWCKRNPAIASLSAAIAVVLLGVAIMGPVVAAQQIALRGKAEAALGREAAQRERAESNERVVKAEAAKSKNAYVFLQEMLQGVGPSVALGRDTTLLREILDRAARRASTELSQLPDVEADLQGTIGSVYFELGDYAQAEAMHRRALELRRSLPDGEERPSVATSLNNLANALSAQGKLDEAEALYRDALARWTKSGGQDSRYVAAAKSNLAQILAQKGNLADAETMQREALDVLTQENDESRETATALSNLAHVLELRDKLAEAEAMNRDALALRRKLFPKGHPDVATSLNNLASVLAGEGNLSDAEAAYREALALWRKLLPGGHLSVSTTLNNLAKVLVQEGKLDEAEAGFREALSIRQKHFGSASPEVMAIQQCLDELLARKDKQNPINSGGDGSGTTNSLPNAPDSRQAQQP